MSNDTPQPQQLYLDLHNLPFVPNFDDILYFDGSECIKVEKWRVEYFFDDIKHRIEQEMEYINIDDSPHAMFKVLLRIIHSDSFWTYFTEIQRQSIEKEMLPLVPDQENYLGNEYPFRPSFLIYERVKDEHTIRFRRYPFSKANPPQQVLAQVLNILKERDELDGKIFARKMELTPGKDESQINAALNDARIAIKRLRQLGVDEHTIKQLLVCNDQPYELHLLNNGRLYAIPRYKDGTENEAQPTEIRLSPLEKAVYILFLNHPEGIMFSYLPDYREELMRYYRQLMNYRTTQQMIKSVDDVTDPTLNSINEKCARIRRAFIDAIGESNADNYCVTGTRNFPKGVRLDRSLVHCQIQ